MEREAAQSRLSCGRGVQLGVLDLYVDECIDLRTRK